MKYLIKILICFTLLTQSINLSGYAESYPASLFKIYTSSNQVSHKTTFFKFLTDSKKNIPFSVVEKRIVKNQLGVNKDIQEAHSYKVIQEYLRSSDKGNTLRFRNYKNIIERFIAQQRKLHFDGYRKKKRLGLKAFEYRNKKNWK